MESYTAVGIIHPEHPNKQILVDLENRAGTDKFKVIFVRPLIPLFRTSGDVCSGFQSQSEQPYSCLAEAYVLHITRDSPLV